MKLPAIVTIWEGLRGFNCQMHSASICRLPSAANANCKLQLPACSDLAVS